MRDPTKKMPRKDDQKRVKKEKYIVKFNSWMTFNKVFAKGGIIFEQPNIFQE